MAIVDLRLVAVVTAAALMFVAVPEARAQSVEAETLFREGKKLIKEGKLAEGCDKLDASDRIEPSVGTELNLGDCREKNNQLASAWAAFLKAASNAKKAGNDKGREKEARARATKLEHRLSYLTISVPDANRVEGLTISRNGVPVDSALWNTGVPVDAGTYEITGQAPGHEAWTTSVKIVGEADEQSVEVPRFKSLEDLVPKEDDKPPPDEDPDVVTDPDVIVRDGGGSPGMFTTKRKIAAGVGVVGLLGIAGSVMFGLQAKDLQSQADEICPEAACNDQMAIDLNEDAQGKALLSNVFLGVGVAAVAGAVVLWFLGAPDGAPANDFPDDDEDEVTVTPMIGHDHVSVTLGRRF